MNAHRLEVQIDSSGQPFVDIPSPNDEHVRATFIGKEKAGYKRDSLRIQIRGSNGMLRPGPEVPVELLGSFFAAIVDLVPPQRPENRE